nr:unnamed protein product [Digitaria exilis]
MSLAAFFVFLVVSAPQLVDRYLDLARKVSADLPPASLSRVAPPIRLVASRPGSPRGSQSDEQIKLRLEIKELLKEANQLSTPSTFAQAAKLKRLAAAKEKELAKSWNNPVVVFNLPGQQVAVPKVQLRASAEPCVFSPSWRAHAAGMKKKRRGTVGASHPSATPRHPAKQSAHRNASASSLAAWVAATRPAFPAAPPTQRHVATEAMLLILLRCLAKVDDYR